MTRRDLSFNKLKSIASNQFHTLNSLNNLQVDNNQIRCIEEGAFDQPNKLSILYEK